MRVVCEACQAKYQIADERVAGRALKIRCRKCGSAISVRGDAVASEMDVPGEWFVSTDGNPSGPLTIEQLAGQLASGEVDWDAHVWREGYVDWETASNSDTVVRAVASVRASQPAAVVAAAPVVADDTQRTSISETFGAHAGDEEPTRVATEDSLTSVQDGPTRMVATTASQPPYAVPASQPPLAATASEPPGSLAPRAREAFATRAASGIRNPSQPPLGGSGVSALPRASSAAPLPRASSAPSLPSIVVAQSAPPSIPAYGAPPPIPSLAPAPQAAAPAFARAPSQPPSVFASAAPSQPPMRAGYAAGEGSGLIDIRALASLAQSRQSVAPSASAPAAPITIAAQREPLTHLGTSTFAHLDSLSPVANKPRSSNTAVPLAILAGFAMVAAAAAAVLYITRAPAPIAGAPSASTAPAAAAQPIAPLASAMQPVAALTAVAPAAEPDQPQPVAEEPAEGAEAAGQQPPVQAEPVEPVEPVAATPEREPSSKSSAPAAKRAPAPRAAKTRAADSAEKLAAAEPEQEADSVDDILLDKAAEAPASKSSEASADPLLAEPTPAPTPAKPATPSEPRSIDDLLEGAVAKSAAPAASNLPESPSRDEVLSVMRGIEDEVRACAASEPVTGTANVQLTVVGTSGRVLNAQVTGIQGTIGSCIARVARSASFKPFSRERFSINYPYKFKP